MSLQISVRVRRATQLDFNRVINKWGVLLLCIKNVKTVLAMMIFMIMRFVCY